MTRSVDECSLRDLPVVHDPRGNLSYVEGGRHIPFDIQRVFYLYDVPGGASRAGHALKSCHQFIVAMSGSFDVILRDGRDTRRIHLCRSYYGLHLPPLIWRELDNFSSGAVCMVLASERYSEEGYFRSYDEFKLATVREV